LERVACKMEVRNPCEIVVGKLVRTIRLERHRRREKMYLILY
jgi:hypothetical protein